MSAEDGRPVPSGRLRRMMALGGLATGIGGRVLAEGAMRLAQGERPRLPDLLLTPANARRVVLRELAGGVINGLVLAAARRVKSLSDETRQKPSTLFEYKMSIASIIIAESEEFFPTV